MLANQVADPLAVIFNESLATGNLPEDWKTAVVTPIFKHGGKEDPGNYRPVSLTSVPCKVLERILRRKICAHLTDHNLINSRQHGFLPGRSCLSNLLGFLDEVADRLDRGESVEVIYMDFKKAFDSVNHRLLIAKLHAYGVAGNICRWIQEFLNARTFRVRVRDTLSDVATVSSGVPQGSVLGPLLFLIFVNDVTEDVASPCWLFADDLKLLADGGNRVVAQADLDTICSWAKAWDLPFNEDKCQHLAPRCPEVPLQLTAWDGSPHEIAHCSLTRDLGIQVSADFKASRQCAAAATKARRALFQLRAAISCKDVKVFVPLYCAFVRPHLEYCVQAWAPYLKKDIQLLEKVQRLATRMVKGTRGMTYLQRLSFCGLFSLERRRLRGDLLEVYRILQGEGNCGNEHLLNPCLVATTRGHELKLNKPRARLDLRKFGFSHRVVNPWNRLPGRVVSAPSLEVFKRRLDEVWSEVFPTLG